MILKDKNAVLYGVSESLGGAMALALSEAGAKVFLTAHRLENARKIADDIRAAGGRAEADEVDAARVAMIEWVGASVPADPMIELELVRGGRAECHGRNSATRKQLGARSLTIKQPTAAQRGKKKPRRKSLSSLLTIH
jgi:NAD(P)-dependent dehydrogenase (short-subunit alcohol dehydrogenase family)